jgi:hypothetical protein
MRPEDRSAMLDIIFESALGMNEWISFETRFAWRTHSRVEKEVEEMNELLPKLYLQVLLILSSINEHCSASGLQRRRECFILRIKTTM